MLRDLLARPHKQRIVNMESTAGERQQADQRNSHQKPIGIPARPPRQQSFVYLAETAHHNDGRNLFRCISLTLQQKGSSTDSKSGARMHGSNTVKSFDVCLANHGKTPPMTTRFATDRYSSIFVLLPGGNRAVLIKYSLQLISNIRGITVLDITALHHVDELPFSK